MPRLRIATGLCISLLLMLLGPLSAQAQDGGWSLLLDPKAELQIDDIRRPEQRELFTP